MWFHRMAVGGRPHRLVPMVLVTGHLDPSASLEDLDPSASLEGRQREALRAIVAELGDRLDEITFSDYRALRESSAEPLPSPAAIWEMFGGFHRMRERATTITAG